VHIFLSVFANAQTSNIGGIINSYVKVDSIDGCQNRFYFNTPIDPQFKIGDTVVVFQMKGAEIFDGINTSKFGRVKDYKNAGVYEINYIRDVGTDFIELQNVYNKDFLKQGRIQLVRMPFFQSAVIINELSAPVWKDVGGVIALRVKGKLELNANINADGLGFDGGRSNNKIKDNLPCGESSFFLTRDTSVAATKGSSYVNLLDSVEAGRGKNASGGGGGNSKSAGGGGGANGGSGGQGGAESDECGNFLSNGGLGADSIDYNQFSSRLFLGSGGGGGHVQNISAKNAGGNGGGIVIIIADTLVSNGYTISANGESGVPCSGGVSKCANGMGGGGSGGSIFMEVKTFIDQAKVQIIGGRGADVAVTKGAFTGPGGGGGGGVLLLSGTDIPYNLNVNFSGGLSGVVSDMGNETHFASSGKDGKILTNRQLVHTNRSFERNIQRLDVSMTEVGCTGVSMSASAVVLSAPVKDWKWIFPDTVVSSINPTIKDFKAPGSYEVSVIATDTNSCSLQLDTTVVIRSFVVDAGADRLKCKGKSIELAASGAENYIWQPAPHYVDPTVNPVTFILDTTSYAIVIGSYSNGCSVKDSLLVSLQPRPNFSITENTMTCKYDSVQLEASGADTYLWQPSTGLSSANNSTVSASPDATTQYTVFMENNTCGDTASKSVTVSVLPLPVVSISKSNDVNCTETTTWLSAKGGQSFLWEPDPSLESVSGPIVKASPRNTTTYKVEVTDVVGCKNTDSIIVKFDSTPYQFFMPNAFTPNNDGLNDIFRIKFLPPHQSLHFSIYNRFGQKMFETTDMKKGWDGTVHSFSQPIGTYIVMINVQTLVCGTIQYKGTVQLMR
jgi:gliding motility-associated-like protein